ncbi:hypothetical protein SLH49_20795 [Cognatiyoonia sp. IB215446]|uniref:hypothetical protein n=1 Tax=Cognatiyoonia sp. IB215446 TaxID=3097355 RepID=UPI002A15267E|nr:hypothetical protein [Cognatiyoonia sp. IB215446]MDX8350435.1 hypothetical protein [Cognatiyoonia sp. IB215446]
MISQLFQRHPAGPADTSKVEDTAQLNATFAERLRVIDRDPYICIADENLRIISVFDDLQYDRADMDMLSGPMRRCVIERLAPLGFRQISGGVLENTAEGIRMLMPKFRALGASPFDAARDTPRRSQDYYILTPTQTACHFVSHYATGAAIAAIEKLIVQQPVNLLRLADYLEKSAEHQAFAVDVGYLRYVQKQAVASEPLRSRRALR